MRWLFAAILASGCYSPHPQPGAPCGTGGCPDGLVCSPATMTCELRAIDAAVDTRAVDSTVDTPPADAPPSGPRVVQQGTNHASSAASLSVTLPNLPASGDVLVMIGGDPAAALTSVSGGGATWTPAARSTVNANVEIWVGVTDGTSAVVTITLTNSSSSMTIAVSEWAGLRAANLIDVTSTGNGVASPADPGPITTTSAKDLLIFAVGDGAPNTFGTPGPGTWAALDGVTGVITQGAWWRYVTATGAFEPTVSETANTWDAAAVALRAL